MRSYRASRAQMDFGRVFSTGFVAWFRNLLPFMAMGLVVYLPMIGFAAYVAVRMHRTGPDDLGVFSLLWALLALLSMVLNFVVTAAVVFGVFEQIRGQRPSIGSCLAAGFSRLGPVLVVSIIVGLAVGIGFLLLCVPGCILYSMWYVAVPVAVVERQGIGGAIARSADLTRGNRWFIFALILILFVIGAAVGGIGKVVAITTLPQTVGGIIAASVIEQVIGLLSGLLGSVMMAVTYHELRRVKEGFEINDLAEVFD